MFLEWFYHCQRNEGHKKWNVLYFRFQVEHNLKENFEILETVCRSQQENNKYYLSQTCWHISWLQGSHCCSVAAFSIIKDWKSVMEQTWERLPLYALPTQTMACASVDGRARRWTSGLNRLKCCLECYRDIVGFAREGLQRAQHQVTGVPAVESRPEGKQSEEGSKVN